MWRVILTFFVGLLLLATPAAAQTPTQDCVIGVSANAAGTVSIIGSPYTPTKIYVVMWTEETVSATAYDLVIPGLNTTIFISGVVYGPSGAGTVAQIGTRSSVGLGECATGSGDTPIVVAIYSLLVPFYPPLTEAVRIDAGNPPEFSDCTEQVFPCEIGPSVMFDDILGDVSTSFSQIKSLY
jgi:hypothetical protein